MVLSVLREFLFEARSMRPCTDVELNVGCSVWKKFAWCVFMLLFRSLLSKETLELVLSFSRKLCSSWALQAAKIDPKVVCFPPFVTFGGGDV